MFPVLFVDDDSAMRLLMKRVLSSEFRVETASGGDEARRILEAAVQPFAVIVADLSMAHGNGLQLLAAVQQLAPETVRILMSGDHRLTLEPGLTVGVDLFRVLLKPVDNGTILSAVRAGVERHAQLSAALAA